MERLKSFCHGMTTSIAGVLMGVGVDDARDKSQERIGLVSASDPTPGLSSLVGRLTRASLGGWSGLSGTWSGCGRQCLCRRIPG